MNIQPQNKKKIQINKKAYKKILYHCLRYPSNKVYGVVVGNDSSNITDAFPLFHTALLNPSFSIALNLVQSNLTKETNIQGFYQLVENGQPIINRFFNKNQELKGLHLLKVSMNTQEIKCKAQKYQINSFQLKQVSNDLKEGKHRLIVDMDAHFQDIKLDFTNKYVS